MPDLGLQVAPGSTTRAMTSSMDFFATACQLAEVPLPSDRTIDAISYADVLRSGGTIPANGRTAWYYWGKNPDPKIGLHAVRMMTPSFGNWKLHWVTEGSHCNRDYPDKACPGAAGLKVLAPNDLLLYNLDVSPGETRNLSITAYPDVVARLTALKLAAEAEPDAFGPSQVNKGTDNTVEPCAPVARAAGCDAAHPNASKVPWPLCCQKAPSSATLWLGNKYA